MVFAEKHNMRPRREEGPHISSPALPPAHTRIVQPENMRTRGKAVEQVGIRSRNAGLTTRVACLREGEPRMPVSALGGSV